MSAGSYIFGSRGRTGPQGPAVSDGDKGDITVTVGGTVYTIDALAVTLAKMAALPANTVIGSVTGVGAPVAMTKAQLLTLLNVADGANVNDVAIQILTNKKIRFTSGAAGAGLAPAYFVAGSLMSVAEIGAFEFDGTNLFFTDNATAGRGQVPNEQSVMLTATGGAITTIANFFGTNKNPVLIAAGRYELEIFMLYTKTTAGIITWTLTNSAAPIWQNIDYEMSPITGIVAPPGTATALKGQLVADATAARTIVTGSITDATNNYAKIRAQILNDTGTRLKIQATVGTGSIAPLKGSFWRLRRLSLSDVGNFAA